MHPVLFRIPGLDFPIRSFGVMVAGGIFLAIWGWGKLLARYGDDPKEDPARASQVALWIVVGVFAGARLMYVAVEVVRYLASDVTEAMVRYLQTGDPGGLTPAQLDLARQASVGYSFVHDPFRVLFIWEGGLVMYGGLIGGLLFGAWFGVRSGLRLWNGFDTALVASFVGLAIGRWGCLLVGDDYGRVVPERMADLPFPIAIRVPDATWLAAHPESLFARDLAGQTLWATQVWMSVNALLIAAIGLWLLRRRRWYGQVCAVMLILYAVSRFVIEMFRGDSVRGLWFGDTVSTSQLISLFGLGLGIFLLWKRPGRPVAPGAPGREATA